MLYKTPLIVLSNKQVFKDKAFQDRMYVYTFKQASYTVKYDRKLNPLMWPLLVDKYYQEREADTSSIDSDDDI